MYLGGWLLEEQWVTSLDTCRWIMGVVCGTATCSGELGRPPQALFETMREGVRGLVSPSPPPPPPSGPEARGFSRGLGGFTLSSMTDKRVGECLRSQIPGRPFVSSALKLRKPVLPQILHPFPQTETKESGHSIGRGWDYGGPQAVAGGALPIRVGVAMDRRVGSAAAKWGVQRGAVRFPRPPWTKNKCGGAAEPWRAC